MKIIEAINAIDAQKPNQYTQSEKIGWLSTLDGMIDREVIKTHEGEDITFNGYTDDTDIDTELLAVFPYDDMYVSWLEARIDFTNGEYNKYNNSITKFNDTFTTYCKWYNREHTPKTTKLKFF